MKKIGTLLAAATLILVFVASLSFAQRGEWKGKGGQSPSGDWNRMYDPKTVQTIAGQVVNVDEVTMMKGRYTGIHLKLKTEKDTTDVHLGPSWYIEKQETKIGKGDTVRITGSRITFQGKPVLIAAVVTKGDKTLKLRDEKGFPLWSGGRRNR